MMPRQFKRLMERRAYRDATWIAAYANMKRGKDDPAVKPEDLLPKRQCNPGAMGPEVFAAFEKAFTNV
jgi:hypothetical protein